MVVAKLQSAAKPLNLHELVEALGADPRTIRKAIDGLLSEGAIVASGRAPKLRYTPAAKAQKPTHEPRTKQAVPQKATVKGRTAAGKAAYDAAVLAALREAGEQARLSALIEKTGGSDDQLRAALHRLIAAGKVKITGRIAGWRCAWQHRSHAAHGQNRHSSLASGVRGWRFDSNDLAHDIAAADLGSVE